MRVALLTLDFAPSIGGVQQYLYQIALRLAQHHDVHVVTPERGMVPAGVPFHRLSVPAPDLWAFLKALRAC